MLPDDRVRVLHMIDAAEAVPAFVAGRRQENLATDRMLRFAVERAIEIIGEAASKVSAATRLASPALPWPRIAAMRNRLARAYFDVDTAILWKTTIEEVPLLLEQLLLLDTL